MTTASSLPHWRSTLKLSTMIVVALVVLVIAIGGQAKADALFAAIWQKDGGPAFQARHNLTGAQFQQGLDQLVGEGFRLTYVNGYTVGGEPHFAAIWEKDGGPAFQARHNLTGAQFHSKHSTSSSARASAAACGKRLCSRRRAALRRHLAEGRRHEPFRPGTT